MRIADERVVQCQNFIAMPFVETGHAEIELRARGPINAEIDAHIGLGLQRVASDTISRAGEKHECRGAVARRIARPHLPLRVIAIGERRFRRRVPIIIVDGDLSRKSGRQIGGVVIGGADAPNAIPIGAEPDDASQARRERNLFTRAQTDV